MSKILAFFHPNGRLDGYYHQPDKLKTESPDKYASMCEKGVFIEEADLPPAPAPVRGKDHFIRLKDDASITTKGVEREITATALEWVTVDRPLTQEEAIEVLAEEQQETNVLLRELVALLTPKDTPEAEK